jgi:hypothetical protein
MHNLKNQVGFRLKKIPPPSRAGAALSFQAKNFRRHTAIRPIPTDGFGLLGGRAARGFPPNWWDQFPGCRLCGKKTVSVFFRGRGFKGGYLFHKLTRRALFTLSIPLLEHVRTAA